MPRNPEFPLLIRDQGVTVKIYRISAPSTRSGTAYKVSWIGSEGSANRSITDLAEAREFARAKAAQLAAGVVSGLHFPAPIGLNCRNCEDSPPKLISPR